MISRLRYQPGRDHFRFSHLSQHFFPPTTNSSSSGKKKMCDNKHAFNIQHIERGRHADTTIAIHIQPTGENSFVIARQASFNTNIRQSIKRWKCSVSLRFFAPSLAGFTSDQDKRDDTKFYSLFSTICEPSYGMCMCVRVCGMKCGVYQNW